ncbi:uncharacterized protein MTES_1411 [Microbacterium testaceum StLB037]|uniref:DUF4393 domain-containing protein n=1 Tax=Microbacterium testaceum (strain StLB037) TaxID=979556 RepID=E8N8D0_MICTS|nr:hypothetical protein [Microbacterium testaceum]BAJ74375.1 uncharacterized protein MTES_1411 [Microbacterium testaceum StLB037]
MVDPMVGAAAAHLAKASDAYNSEAAKAGASLWMKFLGPPVEAMGRHLQRRVELWSEDALANRVLRKAADKVDPSAEGSVPPRVASDIFDKAQWAEDEFVAEYLSGVLASARTTDAADDSAISWTALVGRLSSAQLRLHYILYSTARHHLLGRTIDATNDLDDLPIFAPLLPIIALLPGGVDAFNDAMANLEREGLLSPRFDVDTQSGRLANIKQIPAEPVIVYRITLAGALLFFRGGGSRTTALKRFSDPAHDLRFDDCASIPSPIAGSALWNSLPDASES